MLSFLSGTTPNTRVAWGYRFELTPDHLTPEQAEPMKYSWDKLADAALDKLNEISPPPSKALPHNSSHPSAPLQKDRVIPNRDLFQILKENHDSDPILRELWTQSNTVPDWVDWAQIERGQQVFYRYGGAAINGLAFQSLLGGMGAARVVEVLSRTGGFGSKVARHRLYETTQHVLQCTHDLESVQPGGDGWASSIRVRLLHAAVRKRILKLAETRPSYYSVEKFGIPVNDLDSIGTLTSFSASLIWIALPRQGIQMRRQETEDYLALFRYVGYLLGTPVDFLARPETAKAFMESLLLNEIDPSPTSAVLGKNVIEALTMVPPTYLSREFLEANSRWLLGHELCDRLGLGRPPIYYWALVAGQCIFFMAVCYTYRSFEALDRWKVAKMRKALWAIIIDSKDGLGGETGVFDFKHLPEEGKTTVYEPSGRERLIPSGVERRNLIALGMFGVALGLSALAGMKLIGAALKAAS